MKKCLLLCLFLLACPLVAEEWNTWTIRGTVLSYYEETSGSTVVRRQIQYLVLGESVHVECLLDDADCNASLLSTCTATQVSAGCESGGNLCFSEVRCISGFGKCLYAKGPLVENGELFALATLTTLQSASACHQ